MAPICRFTLATSLKICRQTLHRIETLHDLGWLCRDIKAPNFAIGLGAKTNLVYMASGGGVAVCSRQYARAHCFFVLQLDFGFARRYM